MSKKLLTISLDENVLKKIDKAANKKFRSRSAYINSLFAAMTKDPYINKRDLLDKINRAKDTDYSIVNARYDILSSSVLNDDLFE